MAYSLPSFSAAANYAASYRPIFTGQTLADGYKGIKSDEGVAAMQNALNADFLAKAGMAKSALGEFGAMKRQELVADAAMERLEFATKAKMEIDDRNRSDLKKSLLTNLLIGGASSAIPERRTVGDTLSDLGGINTRSDQEIAKDNALMTSLLPQLKGAVGDAINEMLTTGTAGGGAGNGAIVKTPKTPAAATLNVPKLSENPLLQYFRTPQAPKEGN